MTNHLDMLLPDARRALDQGLQTAVGLSADDIVALRNARALIDRLERQTESGGRRGDADTRSNLFFDISDLLGYYPYNRLPTGVQRVQVNTILAILDAPGDWDVGLCCFAEDRREWLSVPIDLFREVCAMSVSGGDATAPDWLAQVARLDAAIGSGKKFAFAEDAYLVNLGTSWWVSNYFVYIREAKRISNIRFIPLIYDMIPVLHPEYCTSELSHEFIDWLVGIVAHADAFLAISDATMIDLIALAGQLGRTITPDEVAVVPLAADIPAKSPMGSELVARRGLTAGSFVMFVSTIEPRKNQLGAFEAWQRLIAKHGREKIPTLVCVGKRGFRSDQILQRLDMNPELRERVLILERVDDEELGALYDRALFTIYPSFYEGWGLPVTESLGHGKVPLIANNSSLPQAGAGLAPTFETGSAGDFIRGVEELIFDHASRRKREEAIRAGFRPRSWQTVSAEIVSCLSGLIRSAKARPAGTAPLAAPGYYPMTRNRALSVDHLLFSAEMFRSGGGWWRLEDFGAWTKPGGGQLQLRLRAGPARIGLHLAGLPNHAASIKISVNRGKIEREGWIHANERKWIFLDLPESETAGDVTIDLICPESEHIGERKIDVSCGLCGFFVFDLDGAHHHLDFVEAAALGGLKDHQHLVAAIVGSA